MAKPKEEVPVVEPVVEETTKDEKIVESEETKDEKSQDSGEEEDGDDKLEGEVGEGEGDEVVKKRKKKSNNKKKRKRNKQKAAAAAALEASTFNIDNISVFVPTNAPAEASGEKKAEAPKAMPTPPAMPNAPVKAAEVTAKNMNIDAPVFVFDPSKAFTALPASN